MKKKLFVATGAVLGAMSVLFCGFNGSNLASAETLDSSLDKTVTVISTEVIPFDVVKVKDPRSPRNVKLTIQHGKNGSIVQTKTESLGQIPVVSMSKIAPVTEMIVIGTNDNIVQGISKKIQKIEDAKAPGGNINAVHPPVVKGKITTPAQNRAYARSILNDSDFAAMDYIVMRESAWITTADNPHSSAYGVPQSLPGKKMAASGKDWMWNGYTQVDWMVSYVRQSYHTWNNALGFKKSHGWY